MNSAAYLGVISRTGCSLLSAPHSTVLPQTQAGLALWSGTRLCPIPTGAWNSDEPAITSNEISEAADEQQG